MLKPQHNSAREMVSLDGFWQFRCDPSHEGESAGWPNGFNGDCELAVPGSWNEQRSDLAHYFGFGWYQARFHAAASWAKRGVWLHIGSAQRHARVWLNGRLVGGHRTGCLPFECDLQSFLRLGDENVLVIEIDGTLDQWDFPPAQRNGGEAHEGFHNSNPAVNHDFFPYAGLPRSVVIQLTPASARIEALTVTTSVGAKGGKASVKVVVECTAPTEKGSEVTVEIEGRQAKGAALLSGFTTISHVLQKPRLWDIGKPELYLACVTLRGPDGNIQDCYNQVFGVRTVEVRGDEFLLNGKAVFFNGFGKHEDFAVVGRGFVAGVVVRDFDLMKWIGANSFRTSHYPYAEEWYEFADRHGVLVIGETPLVGITKRMQTPGILERARAVLKETVRRDINHPCVVMWSLANEPDIDSVEGEAFFNTLAADARGLDSTRPITYAAHREPENNRPMASFDVVCVNKYFGWYEKPGDIQGSLRDFGACLDRFRAAFGKPVMLAEFGADALSGLHLEPAEMFSEEYQAEIITAQYNEARSRPWVIGAHVWTFADFKTAQSITRVSMNCKGVFTRDRRPKLAAHRLRELWAGRR
jgi:beta-glucuronidase